MDSAVLRGMSPLARDSSCYTTPPPDIYALLSKGVLPEFVPLPAPKCVEFFTGLRRGVLNQLILATPQNCYRPPVKSISLRRAGNARGKRLIVLASLLEYLRSLQAQQTPVPEPEG